MINYNEIVHIENHPYAIVNADNNTIESILFFDSHEDFDESEILNLYGKSSLAISCCEFGEAQQNGTWDGERFYPPKPYKSWIWEDLTGWQPPIKMPTNNGIYVWNEESMQWDLVSL